MRIDAHQHFWDLNRFRYAWIAPASPLARNFMPPDLAPILQRNRFDGTVLVQAHSSVEEAEWCLQLAREYPFIKGVVGWAPLEHPRLGDILDALQQDPRFKGVRYSIHREESGSWSLREDVIPGLKELARRKLTFDLLLRPTHLPLIPRLAELVPDLRMVIDHIAKPPIALGHLDGWAQDMEIAARIPQCYCKLSGMITETDPARPHAPQMRPFLEHAFRQFGPARCLFGSDWPVSTRAATWKETLAAFTQAWGPQSLEIRSQVLGETAVEFYRLA